MTIILDPQLWFNFLLFIVDLLSEYSILLLLLIATLLLVLLLPPRKKKAKPLDLSTLSREDLAQKLMTTLAWSIGLLLLYIAMIQILFNPEIMPKIMNALNK